MGPKRDMKWTEQQGKTAKALAAEGKTASEIAKIVGRARNAVIGYLNRNGVKLSSANGKFGPPIPRKPAIRPERKHGVIHSQINKKMKKPPILAFGAIRTKDGIMGIPFLKAGPYQCRYMIETHPAIICGEPTKNLNCSWCEEHYAIVFIKPEPPRRRTSEDNKSSQKGLGWHRSSPMAQLGR